MATLTRPRPAQDKRLSYEEWLGMPPAEEGKEEVANGEPTRFAGVALSVPEIWPKILD